MKVMDTWNYASLACPPPSHPDNEQWASSIYRGLVPAKNIGRRDFAINGAVVRRFFLVLALFSSVTVYDKPWLCMRSVGTLDIFLLPQRQDASSFDYRRSPYQFGEKFSMDEEAIP